MSGETLTPEQVRELLEACEASEDHPRAQGWTLDAVSAEQRTLDARRALNLAAPALAHTALSALARAEAAERRQEAALARVSELQNICIEQAREIEQTLGRALGFPEMQTLPEIGGEPGDTSVQVFEHTAESLALKAASRLERQRDAAAHALASQRVPTAALDRLLTTAVNKWTRPHMSVETGLVSHLVWDLQACRAALASTSGAEAGAEGGEEA